MKFLIVIFTFSCVLWGQLIEEKYEEENIRIVLEKDTQLREDVKEIWKILDKEEQSQSIFFNVLNQKIKKLLLHNAKSKLQYEKLTLKYSKIETHMQQQQKAHANMQKNLQNAYGSRDSYKKKCQNYMSKLGTLNDNLVNEYQKNEKWKKKYADLNNSANEYNKKYQNSYQQYQRSKKDNEGLVYLTTKLQKEKKSYFDQYNNSNQQCQQAKKDNEDLLSLMAKLQKEKKSYFDQYNNSNQQCRQAKRDNEDLLSLMQKLQKEKKSYFDQYSNSNQQCQQAKKDNEDLLSLMAKLQKEKKSYFDQYSNSNQQCQQAKKDNEDLISLMNTLQSKNQKLQNQLANVNKNYNSTTNNYKNLQQDRDSLWQKNKNLSQQITDLSAKLSEKSSSDFGKWYIISGRGSARKVALTRAWKKAMLSSLEQNYAEDDFESHQKEIQAYLGKNWKKYTVGSWDNPKVVRPYRRRSITVRIRLLEDALLHDIRYRFDKTRHKLKGLHVALVSESRRYRIDAAKDSMFNTLQDKLGQDMVIRDLRSIDTLMKKEAQMLGLAAGADPSGYVARKFNQVNVLVYLDIETYVQNDPYMGKMIYAKMKCRGVWRQTAQELWKFQIISGKQAKPVATQYVGEKMARAQAAKNVALIAYKKIRKQIRTRKTILPSQTYELKFVGLGNDKDRIQYAIADLKDGKRPMLKILPGSYSAGSDYFVVKIKWLRSKHSIDDIISHIKEACEINEIEVVSGIYSKGVIIFEAPSYDDEY